MSKPRLPDYSKPRKIDLVVDNPQQPPSKPQLPERRPMSRAEVGQCGAAARWSGLTPEDRREQMAAVRRYSPLGHRRTG